jgi:hypothetical protein
MKQENKMFLIALINIAFEIAFVLALIELTVESVPYVKTFLSFVKTRLT